MAMLEKPETFRSGFSKVLIKGPAIGTYIIDHFTNDFEIPDLVVFDQSKVH
jgi:hypothetical protein